MVYQDKWVYLLSFGTVVALVLMPTWFFSGIEQVKCKINIATT
jgi:PST family polysaccharide transporter